VGISALRPSWAVAIFIYVTVGSLLWGKKLEDGAVSASFTPLPRAAPSAVAQSYGSMGFAAPGTFVLAMVFLVSFVLYYFINWKYLSTVWGLS
jgi:cytochrome c oxidase subunit 1